jgi:hypothetical protein
MRRYWQSKAYRKAMSARMVPLIGPGSETDKKIPQKLEDEQRSEKSDHPVSSSGERKKKENHLQRVKSSVALFEDCPIEEALER